MHDEKEISDEDCDIRTFYLNKRESKQFLKFVRDRGYKAHRDRDGSAVIFRENVIEGVVNEIGLWIYTDFDTWCILSAEYKRVGRTIDDVTFPLENLAEDFILRFCKLQ